MGRDEMRQGTKRQSYAEVGERVTGILQAAEDSAEQILKEAKGQAEAIVREAERSADARRDAAANEADAMRAEAESTVAKLLAEAETHASMSRAAAEEMSATLDGRLRQMLESARDVTATLELALGTRREGDPYGETLIDALDPDRRY